MNSERNPNSAILSTTILTISHVGLDPGLPGEKAESSLLY
jgi:hypothetical protein